jgi:DNA polymerase III gamma/tau subunit
MENKGLFKEYEGIFSTDQEVLEIKEKTEREYAYSPFALQDAIGERNVKKVWIEYNKLIFQGIEPEDLIHKIISKVRDLAAIYKGATATDLGIKDYPYNKSKRDLKNWKEKDLINFYTKLVSVYHKSRMGGETLELALEKILLKF